MSITDQLASSPDRRDEVPNKDLAKQVVIKNDVKGLKELFANLGHKNKNIQSDCIKVIDEIGSLKPALVAPYANELIALLGSSNNRLQWGAMTALDAITRETSDTIYAALPGIIAVAGKGSVITNDHCVNILVKLSAFKEYTDATLKLLIERLKISPPNQLSMYAENALPVINEKYKPLFVKTLSSRLGEIEKETKRKRVEKVLKKLQGN